MVVVVVVVVVVAHKRFASVPLRLRQFFAGPFVDRSFLRVSKRVRLSAQERDLEFPPTFYNCIPHAVRSGPPETDHRLR